MAKKWKRKIIPSQKVKRCNRFVKSTYLENPLILLYSHKRNFQMEDLS